MHFISLLRRAVLRTRHRFIVVACLMAGGAAQSGVVFSQEESEAPAFVRAAESRNLAAGFRALPRGSRLAIMPVDMELFSMSAGGVLEPRADWTASAVRNFKAALAAKRTELGLEGRELSEADADELDEINTLHAAVARSIAMHHFGGPLSLPTKEDKLDWSLGEAVRAIKEKSGAEYALFTWVRDSYASAERKAAMVALALLGVGIVGGSQIGYASLVDLNTGQVMWFNRLIRTSGDLREAEPAAESLNALLAEFPVTK